MSVPYVELQVTSSFSFLRSGSQPDELIFQAKALGYDTIGLTDWNTVAGVIRAHLAAREAGLRLLPGCRLSLRDGSALLMYPRNRAGWAGLCQLLTLGHHRGERDVFLLGWEDLVAAAPDLLLILLPPEDLAALPGHVQSLLDLPGHREGEEETRFLALTLLRQPGDLARLHAISAFYTARGLACVVTGDVLYHDARRHVLQDVVTAIREGCTVDALGNRRHVHADRHLKAPEEQVRLFAAFPDALANTRRITEACAFSLDDLTYQYPTETERTGESAQDTLTRLVQAALPHRYPAGAPPDVETQIAHELRLIGSLSYAPYFLTVNTIVRHARSLGIVCQGRGSAANSAVCYVLGITSIDPVRSGLLFERFISAERQEPPDIDVDFESDRREEVIQWIYRHYGRHRAALCATVQRYQPKGALREVGKVLGLPEDLTGQLSKHIASSLADPDLCKARAADLGLNLKDRRLSLTFHLARLLLGFPRQLGTHPGGFVLTEDRLDELVPLMPTAMDGRQIIIWDKDDIDVLRFMKVDVLGLGMLGCLRRGFELLHTVYQTRMDLAAIPAEDPQTYRMIQKADTLGTFQIESRAQMSMLPRMKPRTFYDLVIQVAIVRPGPIQMGWTASMRHQCAMMGSEDHSEETARMKVTIIGLDIAKSVFQAHGTDANGKCLLKKKLGRSEVVSFFEKVERCQVVLEACSTSHHWARVIRETGHDVKLIPPEMVKPFVKRGKKNDAVDAAAICLAAMHPDTRFVPIKNEEQQSLLSLHSTRTLLVKQQTMLVNALRALAAEFGLIVPLGNSRLPELLAKIETSLSLPDTMKKTVSLLFEHSGKLDESIKCLEAQIQMHAQQDEDARRLLTIPGIGPVTASLVVASVTDIGSFETARHFAAWLGLVPRQHSSGGKTRLGRITKTGNREIRKMLVLGATSMLYRAQKWNSAAGVWLCKLLERRPGRLATVALANKMARIIWVLLSRKEIYRPTGRSVATV
uniref:IS110 family transposase n=2 Tax=Acetobacterales TaxID=3120395 RepID=UPI00201367A0|nr:IS110 family transposase [Gluconobacter cerinus]